MRNPFLKNKQLVFVANHQDFWILLYRQGGKGFHTNCILAEVSGTDVVYMEKLHASNKVNNLEELLQKLKSKNYSISNFW